MNEVPVHNKDGDSFSTRLLPGIRPAIIIPFTVLYFFLQLRASTVFRRN